MLPISQEGQLSLTAKPRNDLRRQRRRLELARIGVLHGPDTGIVRLYANLAVLRQLMVDVEA